MNIIHPPDGFYEAVQDPERRPQALRVYHAMLAAAAFSAILTELEMFPIDEVRARLRNRIDQEAEASKITARMLQWDWQADAWFLGVTEPYLQVVAEAQTDRAVRLNDGACRVCGAKPIGGLLNGVHYMGLYCEAHLREATAELEAKQADGEVS